MKIPPSHLFLPHLTMPDCISHTSSCPNHHNFIPGLLPSNFLLQYSLVSSQSTLYSAKWEILLKHGISPFNILQWLPFQRHQRAWVLALGYQSHGMALLSVWPISTCSSGSVYSCHTCVLVLLGREMLSCLRVFACAPPSSRAFSLDIHVVPSLKLLQAPARVSSYDTCFPGNQSKIAAFLPYSLTFLHNTYHLTYFF